MKKCISQIENLANNLQSNGAVIARQGGVPRSSPATICTPFENKEAENNTAKSTPQSSINYNKLIESLKTKYRRERRKNDPDLRKMVLVKAEYFKLKNDSSQDNSNSHI